MINIAQALELPVVFIRYNPDSFSIDGERQTVAKRDRLAILRKEIEKHLEPPVSRISVY